MDNVKFINIRASKIVSKTYFTFARILKLETPKTLADIWKLRNAVTDFMERYGN